MQAGFSWRRGFSAAVVPVTVMLAFFAWMAWSHPVFRAWWLVALFVLFEIGLALATSYLSQTGRNEVAKLIGLGATLAAVAGVWWYAHRTGGTSVLTDAERAPLVAIDRNGARRLQHPALGFSILHPGPGFVATAAQPFRADAQFYAFSDREGGEGLTIGLFKGIGDRPRGLRKLVESMGAHASDLAGGVPSRVRVVAMDVPDDVDPPRGELHVIIDKKVHYRLRAYGWPRPSQEPMAVLIAIMSRSPDAHADVLASFQP